MGAAAAQAAPGLSGDSIHTISNKRILRQKHGNLLHAYIVAFTQVFYTSPDCHAWLHGIVTRKRKSGGRPPRKPGVAFEPLLIEKNYILSQKILTW
jgi:hypothetical protein